ncbi:MAG: NUDIX domain-containing protein [Phycisphaerae bacterium]|jgi:mutator protein MutT
MSKPIHRIAVALVHRDGRWLVAKRPSHVHLPSVWEYPGGKIEAGEEAARAAEREVLEETGVHVTVERVLPPLTHDYDDRIVELTPVICRWQAGEAQPLASDECRWVTVSELRTLEMPPANEQILVLLPPLE